MKKKIKPMIDNSSEHVGLVVSLKNDLHVKITCWVNVNETFSGVVNMTKDELEFPLGLQSDSWLKSDITGWVRYSYGIRTFRIGKRIYETGHSS